MTSPQEYYDVLELSQLDCKKMEKRQNRGVDDIMVPNRSSWYLINYANSRNILIIKFYILLLFFYIFYMWINNGEVREVGARDFLDKMCSLLL